MVAELVVLQLDPKPVFGLVLGRDLGGCEEWCFDAGVKVNCRLLSSPIFHVVLLNIIILKQVHALVQDGRPVSLPVGCSLRRWEDIRLRAHGQDVLLGCV